MPITVNEGGVLHELETVTSNEGGVLYEFDTVHANEGGVLREIFRKKTIEYPTSITGWKYTTNGGRTFSTSSITTSNSGLTVKFNGDVIDNTTSSTGALTYIESGLFELISLPTRPLGISFTITYPSSPGTGYSFHPYLWIYKEDETLLKEYNKANLSGLTYSDSGALSCNGKYFIRARAIASSSSGAQMVPFELMVKFS